MGDNLYNFFNKLKLEALVAEELESSLLLAEIYGSLLWAVNIGIYDACVLEESLIKRCASTLTINTFLGSRKDSLHVISEPYLVGGHTRLMENLASMHPEKTDLLVTRLSTVEALKHTLMYFDKINFIKAKERIGKIGEIVEILIQYKRVILHIHPDDIITTIACGIAKKLNNVTIFFVNHADHVFSFGTSIADYYFEISTYGKKIDELKMIRGRKTFLGIPVSSSPKATKNLAISANISLKFISAASAMKFKPRNGFDMRPSIVAILDNFRQSQFWIIGANPNTDYWWWWLKIKYWNRFFIISSLPYEIYKRELEQADFYVDSYPVPGGTAFAEQSLQGRRCIGLISPVQGYSPADCFKSIDIEDFMKSIRIQKDYDYIIKNVLEINGKDAVKKRYLDCLYEGKTFPNIIEKYVPWNGDINFFYEENKINSPIPISIFLKLSVLNKKIAYQLFIILSTKQRIKIILKIIGVGVRKGYVRFSKLLRYI